MKMQEVEAEEGYSEVKPDLTLQTIDQVDDDSPMLMQGIEKED